ncbi:RNA chaperone Hfq [Sphingomonas sp.]|uniref:RNA chaperone Hfq n=2 Tax=Sphingomonas sp. TaxID=28214 RepID=UPI003F700A63
MVIAAGSGRVKPSDSFMVLAQTISSNPAINNKIQAIWPSFDKRAGPSRAWTRVLRGRAWPRAPDMGQRRRVGKGCYGRWRRQYLHCADRAASWRASDAGKRRDCGKSPPKTVSCIMADKQTSLQDLFLNALRKSKTPVTMFLVKGVKLQGIVTWFDNFSVLLRRDGQSQLIYKHAISTIMPSGSVDVASIVDAIPDTPSKNPVLQEIFLGAVKRQQENVTMFLVNGVMLQGGIAAFDLFCMLLQRDGVYQLVYKHAVSTIQPAHPLDLTDQGEEA